MLLSNVNHEQSLPICRHEVGHYIVAKQLGFKMNGINIKIIDNRGCHDAENNLELYRKLRTMKDILNYLDDRIQILYAGALAQSLSNGAVNTDHAEKYFEYGSDHDQKKALELVEIIRNIRYPDSDENTAIKEIEQIRRELFSKTQNVVVSNERIICKLSQKLDSEIHQLGETYDFSEDKINDILKLQ